jgi:hypothetical protein
MSFAKPKTNDNFADDEYKRLLCSTPGCGLPWSVQIDRPMCSFHQWGTTKYDIDKPSHYFNAFASTDGKGWARLILDRKKNGERLSPMSVKFAEQALERELKK